MILERRLQPASSSIGVNCGGVIESGRAALEKGATRPDMQEKQKHPTEVNLSVLTVKQN
jgi:hypothetical protein